MTPVELSRTVLRAVRRAVDDGELDVVVPGRVKVMPPGAGGCGDYATNVALQLARPAGQPALDVAEILRRRLAHSDGIRDVVVTGPGFLNISLRGDRDTLVREILRLGERYGHADRPTDRLVHLDAPHEVRAVVVMDAVARLLRSQGALVHTHCAARPEAGWTDLLGAEVHTYGTLGAPRTPDAPAPLDVHADLRPVPADADPLPLGRDAARWALLHPAPHDRPRITADHLVQRESNPLFRVRYAHARTRALTRNAADLGFHAEPGESGEPGNVDPRGAEPAVRESDVPESDVAEGAVQETVVHDTTTLLRNALADHPRVLRAAATHHAPDRLARHLVAVADAVLPLLAAVLPRGAEKPSAAHRARLALAEAAGAVLAGGLSLLGIDAPEHL
ncbi:ArgS-related anticodon-binding protein NrtL [Streptomyces sp. NPDC102270]|uniref:ArgS-related anticodon-binding protein NrtL n=1 Tax=Streptomyces sp. NPDC102270 TaxID=3366150 RepID=UPI00381E2207